MTESETITLRSGILEVRATLRETGWWSMQLFLRGRLVESSVCTGSREGVAAYLTDARTRVRRKAR